MNQFINAITPAQLEEIFDFHFKLLFSRNDSVVVNNGQQNLEFLRCAVTEKGWAILIELNNAISPYTRSNKDKLRLIRGNIRVEETEILIEGNARHFLSIACRKSGLLRLFTRLMGDVIWHLFSDGPASGDPWNFITERLSGWRLLFVTSDVKTEEKGLLGELLILQHMIKTYRQPITSWTGPLGGVKDFRVQNRNIEVKTTSVRYGYLIEVSGLFQTEMQQASENLVFIRIEESPNGTYSVPDLISDIIRLCTEQKMLQDEFTSRLDNFSDEVLTSNNRCDVLEAVIMDITTDFPKISRDSFANRRLPDGIINIKWTSDLAMLEKTPISEFNFLS